MDEIEYYCNDCGEYFEAPPADEVPCPNCDGFATAATGVS